MFFQFVLLIDRKHHEFVFCILSPFQLNSFHIFLSRFVILEVNFVPRLAACYCFLVKPSVGYAEKSYEIMVTQQSKVHDAEFYISIFKYFSVRRDLEMNVSFGK